MSRTSAFAASALATFVALAPLGPAGAYEEVAVTDGGTISGTVKFVGPAPKLEPLKVTKDQATCGNTALSEALLVSAENKGLKNAVVFLEKVEKGKKPDAKVPVLDNAKCVFVPHVLAVPVGTTLDVKNSDAILHNTHSYLGAGTVFNLALPIQNQVIKRKLTKEGAIRVQCDAHTHMSAWVVAVAHPYFAVADENGGFKITDVPPGKYKLVAWHEPWTLKGQDKGGRPLYGPEGGVKLTQEITVAAKGEAKVTVEFK